MVKNTINFEHLADWMDGRLSEEESVTIVKQLESADEATRENAEWLRAFTKTRKAALLTSPPRELRAELMRRFKIYTSEHKRPSFFKRLVASLTFDSGMQFATAGLRSVESPSSQRQLVYSSAAADVILNFQPRLYDKNVDIVGQFLPSADSLTGPFSIQLLQDATELQLTAIDEIGEFSFKAVPPGVYTMILNAEQVEIVVFPMEINL